MGTEGQAPRIIDPGGDGWAQEPKVSQAETLLYGDTAGVVRLLGQAAVAAQDAYSLTCKHRSEAYTDNVERQYDAAVDATYALYQAARQAQRDVAAAATARMQDIYESNERTMAEPLAEPVQP